MPEERKTPNKPKWVSLINEAIYSYDAEVASIWHPDAECAAMGSCDLRLARIESKFLLVHNNFSFDNHYQWLDSPDQVKEQIKLFLSDTCEDLGWKSFSEPEKIDSLKDLAPLFGKNWTAEEIIRAIEEDEYLIISILEEYPEFPDEYY